MQRGVKHAGAMSGDRGASCPEVRLIEVAKSRIESSVRQEGPEGEEEVQAQQSGVS